MKMVQKMQDPPWTAWVLTPSRYGRKPMWREYFRALRGDL